MGNILQATQDVGLNGIHVTNLMSKSNLPHPRLTAFVEKLTGNGLINKIEVKGSNVFIITEKGILYLQEYKKFSSIAESFGLEM